VAYVQINEEKSKGVSAM